MPESLYRWVGEEEIRKIGENIDNSIKEYGLSRVVNNPVETVGICWGDLKEFLSKKGYLKDGELKTANKPYVGIKQLK